MNAPANFSAMDGYGVHVSLSPRNAVLFVKTDADSLDLFENADSRQNNAMSILDNLIAQTMEEKPTISMDQVCALLCAMQTLLAESKELFFHAHEAACKGSGIVGHAGDGAAVLPVAPKDDLLAPFVGCANTAQVRKAWKAMLQIATARADAESATQ